MHSQSAWQRQAIPTVIDDGPTAIAPRVHRIPTITRRQEATDRHVADVRAGLVALRLHPEQVDRVMAEVEAMAAEAG